MGKMQDEIKSLRRQNRHLENIVQRQRQHIEDAESVIEAFRRGVDAHYAACAVQFGEKREDWINIAHRSPRCSGASS